MFINMQMANPLSPFKCVHTIYLHLHFPRLNWVFLIARQFRQTRSKPDAEREMNVNISHKLHVDCQAVAVRLRRSKRIDWLMDGRLAGRLADWRNGRQSNWLSDFSFEMDFSWVFKWLPGCRDWHFIWAKSASTRTLCNLLPNCRATQKTPAPPIPTHSIEHSQQQQLSTHANCCSLLQFELVKL